MTALGYTLQTGDPSFAVGVNLTLGGERFTGVITVADQVPAIAAFLQHPEGVNLYDWMQRLVAELKLAHIPLPGVLRTLSANAHIAYSTRDGLLCYCAFSPGVLLSDVTFRAHNGGGLFGLTLQDFDLRLIPVVGDAAGKVIDSLIGADDFAIRDMSLVYVKNMPGVTFKNRQVTEGAAFFCRIMGYDICIESGGGSDRSSSHDRSISSDRSDSNDHDSGPDPAPGDGVTWIDLNKTISVITIHRVGVKYENNIISAKLDVSLNVSLFKFTVLGAELGYNLNESTMVYGISGFGVLFKNDLITIGGDFVKNNDSYAGSLLVQVKQISLFAIAEYSKGYLFAYVALNATIGGPPACFITGIALGFGYNKRLTLPNVYDVPNYPLIKGATGALDQSSLLTQLSQYIKNEDGQLFLTAGLHFTSFGIADSFVLLSASFGNDFELGVVGISNITMPPNCQGATPIAYAQLAIRASVRPASGLFSLEACLTDKSYIFSKACKISGNFAFFLWFSGERQGDFVISLGGYHPRYAKPAHYPSVPRLSFRWAMSSKLSVTGSIYFALTPSAIMAGGRLDARYTDGRLKAWFIAQADCLISWKPFHYDISISISIGVSYRLNLLFVEKTVSMELSVGLHIWGPDFSGTAHVSLWFVSFTIRFGANAARKAPPISWQAFKTSFLPQKDHRTCPLTVALVGAAVGTVTNAAGQKEKMMCPDELEIRVVSVIPETNDNVCVRPAGYRKITSTLQVTVVDVRTGVLQPFERTSLTAHVPSALWGKLTYKDELVRHAPCGVALKVPEASYPVFPSADRLISLDDLYSKNTKHIRDAFIFKSVKPVRYTDTGTITRFAQMEQQSDAAAKRARFLADFGIDAPDLRLDALAKNAENYFDEDILFV